MKRFRRAPGAILSLLLLGLLIYLLGWSQLLSLKSIVIHGTAERPRIRSTLDSVIPHITLGEPLARIDVKSVSRAFENEQWISRVDVGRSWIHGALTIYVEERKPVAAYVNEQGLLNYFDASGNDFSSPITYSHLPTITNQSGDPQSKRSLSRLLVLLPQDLLAHVQSFHVVGVDDLQTEISISQKRTALIKWGAPTDISLKVAIFHKLLALKESAQANLFDLSNPLSPVTH